jgi:hypothetical protein
MPLRLSSLLPPSYEIRTDHTYTTRRILYIQQHVAPSQIVCRTRILFYRLGKYAGTGEIAPLGP